MLQKLSVSKSEFIIFLLVFALHGFGVVISWINTDFFQNNYVNEDGIIEWLTVVGLIIGAIVCFKRFWQTRGSSDILFKLATIGLGLALLFLAGEEISWGQRIFEIQSGEYFRKHNLQGETNLHNLQIGEVKVNKLVFSIILFSVVSLYLIIVPILHSLREDCRAFFNKSGVLVPKRFHIAGFAIFFLLTQIASHNRKDELMEFAGVFMFLLIIWYPVNKKAFS